MTSLMTIFLAIGSVGFLFLILSFLIGDLFDAFGIDFGADLDSGHDFGVFDSRVISIFLTAFGGFGAIGVTLGYGVAGSSLFGMMGGVVFGMIVYYFGKFLHGQQSSSSINPEDLVGRRANVTVSIMPDQIGQISCLIGDERIEKLARATGGEEILAGRSVIIQSVESDAVFVAADNGEGFSLFSEKS